MGIGIDIQIGICRCEWDSSSRKSSTADERKLTYQANGLYDPSSRYPLHVHAMDFAF